VTPERLSREFHNLLFLNEFFIFFGMRSQSCKGIAASAIRLQQQLALCYVSDSFSRTLPL
jgi:hypothetical protein